MTIRRHLRLITLLWASDTYALSVVFQAMDAAGKDSTIKHVMSVSDEDRRANAEARSALEAEPD